MRILLASNYQPPHMGGIEFAAQSLKACWEHDGHDVTWLTTDIPKGERPSTKDNIRIPAWNFLENRFQINAPLISPFSIPAIRNHIQQHDAVITHSLAPGLALAVMLEALRLRKPVVVTQHVGVISLGWGPLSWLQKAMICRMARHAVNKGAALTFVGEAVREWCLDNTHIDPSRTAMTPAGIDQKIFYQVSNEERLTYRTKWVPAPHTTSVLFVGRFYDKKGIPLIGDVARNMPDTHFTLVGGGVLDPAEWNLPNVRILSYVSNEELRELYGSHDLLLLPSYGEGWPAVIPQAMICGLPCMISQECFEGYGKDRDHFLVVERNPEAIIGMLQEVDVERLHASDARSARSHYAASVWDWQKTSRIYTDIVEERMRHHPVRANG